MASNLEKAVKKAQPRVVKKAKPRLILKATPRKVGKFSGHGKPN